jgi:hypothetical protein
MSCFGRARIPPVQHVPHLLCFRYPGRPCSDTSAAGSGQCESEMGGSGRAGEGLICFAHRLPGALRAGLSPLSRKQPSQPWPTGVPSWARARSGAAREIVSLCPFSAPHTHLAFPALSSAFFTAEARSATPRGPLCRAPEHLLSLSVPARVSTFPRFLPSVARFHRLSAWS